MLLFFKRYSMDNILNKELVDKKIEGFLFMEEWDDIMLDYVSETWEEEWYDSEYSRYIDHSRWEARTDTINSFISKEFDDNISWDYTYIISDGEKITLYEYIDEVISNSEILGLH